MHSGAKGTLHFSQVIESGCIPERAHTGTDRNSNQSDTFSSGRYPIYYLKIKDIEVHGGFGVMVDKHRSESLRAVYSVRKDRRTSEYIRDHKRNGAPKIAHNQKRRHVRIFGDNLACFTHTYRHKKTRLGISLADPLLPTFVTKRI